MGANWGELDMPMAQLIEKIKDYPIEERVVFADAILQTINPIDSRVERKWVEIAQRRRGEYLLGKVAPISSEDVFAEARIRAGV